MYSYVAFKTTIEKAAPFVSIAGDDHALTEPERYGWARKGVMAELNLDNKIIKNLKIDLLRFEDYEQTYSNSANKDWCRRFWFDVSYEQELWTGPESGTQVVHKRVITKSFRMANTVENFNEAYYREYESGRQYVNKRIPDAVYRVGCYCCYGDGPDLSMVGSELLNGDFEIAYFVDFDFEVPDQDE